MQILQLVKTSLLNEVLKMVVQMHEMLNPMLFAKGQCKLQQTVPIENNKKFIMIILM